MGIRQKVAEEFSSSPNKEGKPGKQYAEDVIVTSIRSENYHEDLANSIFCGVFPGDGWSGRMEDSILQGCIPVIIQVRKLCSLFLGQLMFGSCLLGIMSFFLLAPVVCLTPLL